MTTANAVCFKIEYGNGGGHGGNCGGGGHNCDGHGKRWPQIGNTTL